MIKFSHGIGQRGINAQGTRYHLRELRLCRLPDLGMEEMDELIKGKILKKSSAAPKRNHQKAGALLGNKLFNFFNVHICELYYAPFDNRLAVKSK